MPGYQIETVPPCGEIYDPVGRWGDLAPRRLARHQVATARQKDSGIDDVVGQTDDPVTQTRRSYQRECARRELGATFDFWTQDRLEFAAGRADDRHHVRHRVIPGSFGRDAREGDGFVSQPLNRKDRKSTRLNSSH